MINKNALETEGYRRHDSHDGEYCLGLWQKPIMRLLVDEKDEILYFINVRLWQFPGGNPRSDATVTFYQGDTKNYTTFKVELDSDCLTIAGVETFFACMYSTVCCIPDVHNNSYFEQ